MNDPTGNRASFGQVFRLIMCMLGGALLTWLGWLSCSNASIDLWPLWLLGVVCLLGGGVQLIQTTFQVLGLLIGHTRWRRDRRLGRTPKADALARDADLAEHGRLK